MRRPIFPLIMIDLMAIILIGVAVFMLTRPETNYLETTGTIKRIEEKVDPVGDNQYEYTVYIDYKVGGVEYKDAEYGAYNSSMKEGDTVTVFYYPENPEQIQPKGYKTVPYIVIGISVVAIVGSALMYLKKK